jgi:hypothetical protein
MTTLYHGSYVSVPAPLTGFVVTDPVMKEGGTR